MNRTCENKIFVGHLSLPPLWEAIPSNDILIHMGVGQCAIQTLLIKPPHSALAGEYPFSYEVWARDNLSVMDRDRGLIVIGEQNSNNPISLEITSPSLCEVNSGEVIYLSAMVNNSGPTLFEGQLTIASPEGWHSAPQGPLNVTLEPEESKLFIFAIKICQYALAGEHPITIKLNACSDLQRTIVARVQPKIDIIARVEGCKEAYNLNQMAPLYIRYTNNGNAPLKVLIETQTEPKCKIEYNSGPYEIPPYESIEMPIILVPESSSLDFSQFLLVKLIDVETNEQLYQNPMTLKFMSSGRVVDDEYVRIPGYAKALALSDRHKNILAVEYAGGGLIDAETNRYMNFFFRIPTESQYVIYNIDQRIYFGTYDDRWKLDIGDTIYELSPLTQNFRYGRGFNVEYADEKYSAGVHYTQNTLRCQETPREFCAYAQVNPNEKSTFAANYLHKVQQEIPTSNIFTVQSIVNYPYNFTSELEIGKNFVSQKKAEDTWGYRFETHGKVFRDTWFSLEKVYAGPEFYGYYNNLHLFSSALDFPVSNQMRLNLSTSTLHQNFCLCDEEKYEAIIPKQREFSANLTYSLNDACSLGFNGLLLRGKDLGETRQYNFYQKWCGFSVALASRGYNFNAIVSFGQQRDYLTHKTIHMLQRYYAFLNKNFSSNLGGSVFLDSGNINYYDAKPWRSGYGGSLYYRYASTGYLSLFFQKLKHTADTLDLTQVSLNCSYMFKNLHRIDLLAQHYRYRSHYPNDTVVLFSYTIPLNVTVGTRKDIGHLSGTVHDSWNNCEVGGAIVNCCRAQSTTNEDGSFAFRSVPRGEQQPDLAMLPDNLIAESNHSPNVQIFGGKISYISIPVVPACSIEGEVILFGYADIFALLSDPTKTETIPLNGLDGIRIAIANENEDEVYSCVTNKKGIFNFPKLRPGDWHIKVFSDQIPELHEFSMNNLIITILPAETKIIKFNVMPMAPQIFKLE
jgi:hypothetical protein